MGEQASRDELREGYTQKWHCEADGHGRGDHRSSTPLRVFQDCSSPLLVSEELLAGWTRRSPWKYLVLQLRNQSTYNISPIHDDQRIPIQSRHREVPEIRVNQGILVTVP